MSIYQVSYHANRAPSQPAVVMADSGETITYEEIDRRSTQGAHLFRALGLRRGDTIAILIDNQPRFVEVCLAAQRSGLYYTALSTGLSESEASYILQDCGAKALIGSQATADVCERLASKAAASIHRYAVGGVPRGFVSWEEAIALQPTAAIEDECPGRELLYSSSTARA